MGHLRVRRKAAVEQAMLYDGGNAAQVIAWMQAFGPLRRNADNIPIWPRLVGDNIVFETPAGAVVAAEPNDYIVRGEKGEFSRCFSSDFSSNYEVVKEPVHGPWCLVCDRPPSPGCHGDPDSGEGAHDAIGSVPYG